MYIFPSIRFVRWKLIVDIGNRGEKEEMVSKRMWKLKKPESIFDDELMEKWKGYFRTNRKELWEMEEEYEEMAMGVARYWLNRLEHGPDYDYSGLRNTQNLWNAFIQQYELTEEGCESADG
jgi:hypothetical protein